MADVSKEEALRLVGLHAWAEQVTTCGHTGCTDHVGDGDRLIHTRGGGFGCDVSVEDIEKRIETAQSIQWIDSLLGHDLAIQQANGQYTCVDVPRPKPEEEATTDA